MTSIYPGAPDNLPANRAPGQTIPSAGWNDIADAVNAVQAELGTDPSGAAATVKDRLATVETTAAAAAGAAIQYVAKTGNFTVATADAGKTYEVSSAGAVVVTIPTDTADNIPIGSIYVIRREGTGSVSIAPQTSGPPEVPALHSGYEYRTIARQYTSVTLEKRAANDWRLEGNLA